MPILRPFLALCALSLTFTHGEDVAAEAAKLPAPPYPTYGGHSGTVTLEVEFNAKGNVTSCRVEKSSGSDELDGETVDFIKKRWHSAAFAGRTMEVPICYQPSSTPFGTPPVPNLLLPGEPSVTFTLYVTFDADGYVHNFSTYRINLQLTGYPQIDRRFLSWIYLHWRTKEYRHQTVAVQLHFDPPPPGAKANAPDGSVK